MKLTRDEQLRDQASRNRAISETYAAEGNAEMAAFWEGQAAACEAEVVRPAAPMTLLPVGDRGVYWHLELVAEMPGEHGMKRLKVAA